MRSIPLPTMVASHSKWDPLRRSRSSSQDDADEEQELVLYVLLTTRHWKLKVGADPRASRGPTAKSRTWRRSWRSMQP